MYEITLKCGTRLSLSDLETAGVSYVPCGEVDGKDQPILSFASLWGKRQRVTRETYGKRWNAYTTSDMTGVQIMTGKPTYKRVGRSGYLYYTSLDIEAWMIENYPNEVAQIRQEYEDNVIGTPVVIKTKSGGLRLDAYTEYVGKKMSFKDDKDKMLFEVLADKCLARVDSRYEMVSGSILDIPTLPKSTLQSIYHIISEISANEQAADKPREVVETSQIGNLDIEWDDNGRSQYFTTQHCQKTLHRSNRDEVRFTKYPDGSVDGKCFNCGETWWEIPPKQGERTDKSNFVVSNNEVEPLKALPADHPILNSAPTIEVRETPSYRHFSQEERQVVNQVLSLDPDAGWHGKIPVFTTQYEHLYPLTKDFSLNGQPSEVENRRIFSTLFGECDICGAKTAKWVDTYLLTAGHYCDGCHKDYPLGSYLEIELNRKLPNSIVSEYQGFLGDDPEFADFRLWEPGTFTHIGAAMSTGKSTEIGSNLVEITAAGLGKGIIGVPLVALARFMAYYLRAKHGYRSWGLWHEGCDKDDRFIGDIGAIVCLPSLPRAVQFAKDGGVENLYIAIDEVDFGYNLLSLTINQATAVKACLREATSETGLVVSGQTESTLALEGLVEELEADNVQGFYNTAPPAEGSILLHKHPDHEGKSNAVLAGGIDDTSKALSDGKNVYAFCSSRRDVDIIADEFESENPVVYNAYTKGERRADAVLRNQRLTDSRLFVATSAAGLGISILDPKAHTVVVGGLLYGSRQANMLVQEHVRDRGRRGGDFHYTDYKFSLPVKPRENEKVSLYHETVKQNAFLDSHLPSAGIRKLAYAQALATLADTQIETFLAYHLATVGNIPVYESSALESDTHADRLAVIASKRSEIRRSEREKKIIDAVQLLKDRDILTTSEIRKLSNKGQLSTDERLAHELANASTLAVGWNDVIDRFNGETLDDILSDDDFNVATGLAEKNINTDKLTKQRRGYMAVHFPKWTAHQLKSELENTQKEMVMDGIGIEITAVSDDRLLGELLKALLDRVRGKVFDSTTLANATREVLKMICSTGKSFESEIQLGALGASAYKSGRFLNCADDDRIVEWVRMFISEWYPARIAKSDDNYALQHANDFQLRLSAFHRWLSQHVPDGIQLDFQVVEATELPDEDAELKKVSRFRREAGETIKVIAESLNRNPRTIAKWCEGIKPLAPAQREVMSILGDGKVWKTSDIEKHSRFVRQKVVIALKKLLDTGLIVKIKRGFYQKSEV